MSKFTSREKTTLLKIFHLKFLEITEKEVKVFLFSQKLPSEQNEIMD